MNMDRRSLLAIVPIVVILGIFWTQLLSPARAEVKATQAEVVEAAARRDAAVAAATAAEQARRSYPSDYASVKKLATAVPADEDVAALVRGLDSLAHAYKLDFRTIELGEAVAPEPASKPAAAAPDAAGGDAKAGGEAGAPAGEPTPAGEGDGAAKGTDATAGTDGAATQAPAGTAVGAAGLLTMPFTFSAEGSYLPLQRFLRALHARARHAGEQIEVEGRLLTIDGFSFIAGRDGFPQLGALVSATAYLEPDPGGVIDRSTAKAPASAPATATAPVTPLPAPGAAG
jgi:hypothetical protein